MTTRGTVSEVFLRAFRELPRKERKAVIKIMLGDREFMEDIIDMAEQRPAGSSGGLHEFLSDRRKGSQP